MAPLQTPYFYWLDCFNRHRCEERLLLVLANGPVYDWSDWSYRCNEYAASVFIKIGDPTIPSPQGSTIPTHELFVSH